MKKIIAALSLLAATSVFADSVTIERQNINVLNSGDDQTAYALGYKRDFNKAFAGDVSFTNTQTNPTKALSTRLEGGLTASQGLGPVTAYVRGAVGQKYSNTSDFSYYSIEPGVSTTFGPTTVKLGWRYRTAFDATANGDQTHTTRLGVAYALSKADAIGVGYDRVRGDSEQNVVKVNYTRSF